MSNSKDVFAWLVSHISLDEPPDEIKSIAYLLMDHEYGLSRSQILAGSPLDAADLTRLKQLVARINLGEPVQHILGEQHFYGRPFKVNQDVLIPRPETELLVEKTIEYLKHIDHETSVLDIGTGSGSIAITIELEVPKTKVYATDVSQATIAMAKENAKIHNASIHFILNDVLKDDFPNIKFDAIISNPPYVLESEKTVIRENVLKYEPHKALFVPDENPLLFYKAIARNATNHLQRGGLLALEINERFGNEISDLLEGLNYSDVQISKDFSGKDRIATAIYGESNN